MRGTCSSFLLLSLLIIVAAPSSSGRTAGPAPGLSLIDSLYNQALREYRSGDSPSARIHLEQAVARDSSCAACLELLGWVEYRDNQLSKSEQAFRAALSRNRESLGSRCGLGYILYREQRHAEALREFGFVLARSQGDIDALLGKGLTLLRLGRPRQASETFDLVLKKEPQNQEALRGKARADGTPHPFGGTDMIPSVTAGGSGPGQVSRVLGDHFEVLSDGQFRPFFIKGVNLSLAKPGTFPGEFAATPEDYLSWLDDISDLRANAVRVYTLLPPSFYEALARHNRGDPQRRLWLIQGVWVEMPPAHDYFDSAYFSTFKRDIQLTIDALHGKASLPPRPGQASGKYSADVSSHCLAFILGREWEPFSVAENDRVNRGRDAYHGSMIEVDRATPTEAWVAEVCDFALSYEAETYGWQRPVTFANWPTLDPLSHPTEIALEDEPGKPVYNDDVVTVDVSKLRPTARNRGGVFASYHVYPYHPDFMAVDPTLAECQDSWGRCSYRGYLQALKARHQDIPLLIAEYGVPSSRGNAHPHPLGFDHGHHSEADQGKIDAHLTRDIWETGCAGAIVFSLFDEWFKKTWNAYGREIPTDRDPLWKNLQDPEENFGLIAMDAGSSRRPITIDGDPSDWRAAPLLERGAGSTTSPKGAALKTLYATSDETYLYLRLDVGNLPRSGERRIQWDKVNFLIPMSTYSDHKGDHKLRLRSGEIALPFGAEFLLWLRGERESMLLEDDQYSSRAKDCRSDSNDNGVYVPVEVYVFRQYPKGIQPQRFWSEGMLAHGDESSHPEHHPLVDWSAAKGEGTIEIRLPWGLLKFSDPSSLQVLDYQGSSPTDWRTTTSDGIRFCVLSVAPDAGSKADRPWEKAELLDWLPKAGGRDAVFPGQAPAYLWKGWETPTFHSRRKASFEAVKGAFEGLPGGPLTSFDFTKLLASTYVDSSEVIPLLTQALRLTKSSYARADLLTILDRVRGRSLSAGIDTLFRKAEQEGPEGSWIRAVSSTLSGSAPPGTLLGSLLENSPRKAQRLSIPKATWKGKASRVVIGSSRIAVPRGAIVKTQVERVVRDWLSLKNLDLPPWEFDPVRAIRYHEGARIHDVLKYAGAKVVPVWGTVLRKVGNEWLAPDEEGVFRFPVSLEKVYNYATNKVLSPDAVIVDDTHGVSELVWDTKGASVVLGCGDMPGKAEAAYYLAQKGVNVYCPTDRFVPLLLGTNTPGKVLGSAPIRQSEDGAVIGDQPLEFDPQETIVVSTTESGGADGGFVLQYYDTPYRYFTLLGEYLQRKLDLVAVHVTRDGGATEVVEEARRKGAGVVGIRVHTEEEAEAVSTWLKEDSRRRAVLFHSAAYPAGYQLFFDFPSQTTFDDPYPVVK
jgi:tetratricopeptide (TPR) repeat protein